MKKLLLVFAHPDDESFSCGGTAAKYTEAGWEVDLICATRGEKGNGGTMGDLSEEALGEVRQKELAKAGTILGIHSITFLGYKDGTLSDQTPGEIEDKLYQKIIELVPDCVITAETKGISNHPDHIRLSFAATFAFQKYAAWIEAQLKDVEMTVQTFPKLYYACLPESVVEFLKKKKKLPTESFGKPWRGTPDKSITTVIDISEFSDIKKKALAAHVTQKENVDRFMSFTGHPFLKHEYYVLRMHGTTEAFMGKNDAISHEL